MLCLITIAAHLKATIVEGLQCCSVRRPVSSPPGEGSAVMTGAPSQKAELQKHAHLFRVYFGGHCALFWRSGCSLFRCRGSLLWCGFTCLLCFRPMCLLRIFLLYFLVRLENSMIYVIKLSKRFIFEDRRHEMPSITEQIVLNMYEMLGQMITLLSNNEQNCY